MAKIKLLWSGVKEEGPEFFPDHDNSEKFVIHCVVILLGFGEFTRPLCHRRFLLDNYCINLEVGVGSIHHDGFGYAIVSSNVWVVFIILNVLSISEVRSTIEVVYKICQIMCLSVGLRQQ